MAASGRKRRFGVSLDASLAERLDALAEALGVDRSSLVERAVRKFIDDYKHLLEAHDCSGLLVLRSVRNSRDKVFTVLEKYRDIVVSSNHVHVTDDCVEVVAVRGPSGRIQAFLRELEGRSCNARFIPIH